MSVSSTLVSHGSVVKAHSAAVTPASRYGRLLKPERTQRQRQYPDCHQRLEDHDRPEVEPGKDRRKRPSALERLGTR